MGVNLRSKMIIQSQGDNIVCEVYGQDKETEKWAGAINLYKEGFFHTTLISSNPTFNTSEQAVAYMEKVVRQTRASDISAQIEKVEQIIGSETMDLVKKISQAADWTNLFKILHSEGKTQSGLSFS